MNQPVNLSVLADSLFAPAGALGDSAEIILRAARDHLGMDVAFITEFLDDGHRVFHYVDVRDPARFAASTGCLIVAEGIETAQELATLQQMGVTKGQGFFMSKPMGLADFREVLDEEAARRASQPH